MQYTALEKVSLFLAEPHEVGEVGVQGSMHELSFPADGTCPTYNIHIRYVIFYGVVIAI